jgi:hypothetical protein
MNKTFSQFVAEREYCVQDNNLINEMANLSKESTSLPVIVYVSDSRGVNHGPRIKCNASYGRWSGQSFTITIEHEPRVLGETGDVRSGDVLTVVDWVKLNYDALIQYWRMDIGVIELGSKLQRI